MHPVRKQRLYLVLFITLFSSAAIGLVVYALSGNINLFYPPAEVVAGKAPVGQPIRVGGMVVEDSVQRSDDSLAIRLSSPITSSLLLWSMSVFFPIYSQRDRAPWPRAY